MILLSFLKRNMSSGIIADVTALLFFTTVTSFILELNYSGIVSSVFDIRWLVVALLISISLFLWRPRSFVHTGWKQVYYIVWAIIIGLLLLRFLALQAGMHLLGLLTATLAAGTIIVIVIIFNDQRSNN